MVPGTFAERHRIARRMLVGVAVLGALTACGTAALQQQEERLTFRVVKETPGWYAGLPEGVHEFDIPVNSRADAQRIHAWWWPAANPTAPTVLYLHGTRWSLTGQVFRLEQLRDFGFSVLAIDYRGFGKSDGDVPSERTVYEDAHAAWDWLVAQQPVAARRFIYGHSLGGAVAVDLAASLSEQGGKMEKEAVAPIRPDAAAGGLIIESTFTTLADMAREVTYSWLPVGLLMSQKFDSMSKMARVTMPVLVVHGAADRFVPSRFSQQLYDAATAPKKLLMVEGGGHNNSMRAGADLYRNAFGQLFGLRLNGEQGVGGAATVRRAGG
ncbi:MAG: lysophospholipase [Pseudomonadota bacterium]|nr:lysophospholipase [Pseudomonadota bacterium]